MIISDKLLGTLLGDSYIGKNNERYSFRLSHCPEQLDLIEDIADEIRKLYTYKLCVYYRNKRNIYELYHYNPLFKYYRERYYPNNKKNLMNILQDVKDPNEAVAYWMADDGCIHYSTKNPTYLSPRLLLATCSENEETLNYIINWFNKNYGFSPYIIKQGNKKRNKTWFLLKFKVEDSYKLWKKIRHHIIHIPSMKHKFRVVEQQFNLEFYRIKYNQESSTTTKVVENVRRASNE